MTERVCMLSFWRNDMERNLAERAEHLLSKRNVTRWLWVVGDSDDATSQALRAYNAADVRVMRTGETDRLRCLSQTATYAVQCLEPSDDYVLIHESDLRSPVDIATRYLAHAEAGRCPIAGWPVLYIKDLGAEMFYDIWAYRQGGRKFINHAPYHACYTPDAPFEVDSVGSVWMFAAEDARGMAVTERACVEMCDTLRAKGRRLWVDPTIRIEQPEELWTPTILKR